MAPLSGAMENLIEQVENPRARPAGSLGRRLWRRESDPHSRLSLVTFNSLKKGAPFAGLPAAAALRYETGTGELLWSRMHENEDLRLETLSDEDVRVAAELDIKCQLDVPLTLCPPGTEYCERPVAFIVRQKLRGAIVRCWYSCKVCAAPVMKEVGYRT